jgi:hypothetical protein
MSSLEDQRDGFALVSAVDPKVLVHSNDSVLRVKLAHADQAEVGQIGLAIGVTNGKVQELIYVAGALEGDAQDVAPQHR